jgi:membrane-bound lytic murein transglycosylase B
MQLLIKRILLICLFITTGCLFADDGLLRRPAVKLYIDNMVKQHHFDRKQLVAILRAAQFQPQIIESMEKPFEQKPWDVYQDLFLQPERVSLGVQFWEANRKALDRAAKEYHVPPQIIVAIIGVETLYGKHQGNYRVIDALTTLAFYYPKRSPYFTRELTEFLLLCKEHHVPVTQYAGSYAGAMGKPQFMPSSYRLYAVDYRGNGRPDLMNDDSDAIGSVANYLHHYGWKNNGDIATPVELHGSGYKKLVLNSKTPNYDYKHLLKLGVSPRSLASKQPQQVGLMEFTTQKGLEYWMMFPNFYVITRYNSSPQYALVVYLFSQSLYNRWANLHVHDANPYS